MALSARAAVPDRGGAARRTGGPAHRHPGDRSRLAARDPRRQSGGRVGHRHRRRAQHRRIAGRGDDAALLRADRAPHAREPDAGARDRAGRQRRVRRARVGAGDPRHGPGTDAAAHRRCARQFRATRRAQRHLRGPGVVRGDRRGTRPGLGRVRVRRARRRHLGPDTARGARQPAPRVGERHVRRRHPGAARHRRDLTRPRTRRHPRAGARAGRRRLGEPRGARSSTPAGRTAV